jgi:hypothetical protein
MFFVYPLIFSFLSMQESLDTRHITLEQRELVRLGYVAGVSLRVELKQLFLEALQFLR